MAKKTIEELREFVVKQMPSNSVLLVKPFRTFFDYILDYLADVSSLVDLNKFMYKVFGTTNIDSVNITKLFDDGIFQGETVIEYLLYLGEKVNDNHNIIRIPSATYSELGITEYSTIEEQQQAIVGFLEGYVIESEEVLFFEIK